jgi:hypothetical protein
MNRRRKWGTCVDDQSVSLLLKGTHSATQPRPSMARGKSRCWVTRSDSVTSASAIAASMSPPGKIASQAMLSGAPVCAVGLPGSIALSRSVTAGSGS